MRDPPYQSRIPSLPIEQSIRWDCTFETHYIIAFIRETQPTKQDLEADQYHANHRQIILDEFHRGRFPKQNECAGKLEGTEAFTEEESETANDAPRNTDEARPGSKLNDCPSLSFRDENAKARGQNRHHQSQSSNEDTSLQVFSLDTSLSFRDENAAKIDITKVKAVMKIRVWTQRAKTPVSLAETKTNLTKSNLSLRKEMNTKKRRTNDVQFRMNENHTDSKTIGLRKKPQQEPKKDDQNHAT